MSEIRALFVETAESVVELVGKPEVAQQWHEQSVLAAFRVSGLVGHLVRAVFVVTDYLDSAVASTPPITAAAYFAELQDTANIDSPLNVAVRQRGEDEAKRGAFELGSIAADRLSTLRDKLAIETDDRRVQVTQGRVMVLDEYLRTRIVEMVVHVEDLALSVGAGVGIPSRAIGIAAETMVATARLRHGDLSFLRGMTRRERDDVNATRVF